MCAKLSEKLQQWRAERPDEWTMDEFIRQAKQYEAKIYADATGGEMWWCNKCHKDVPGVEVTYEEYHDGCGGICS